jgi:hypothetical protein
MGIVSRDLKAYEIAIMHLASVVLSVMDSLCSVDPHKEWDIWDMY